MYVYLILIVIVESVCIVCHCGHCHDRSSTHRTELAGASWARGWFSTSFTTCRAEGTREL